MQKKDVPELVDKACAGLKADEETTSAAQGLRGEELGGGSGLGSSDEGGGVNLDVAEAGKGGAHGLCKGKNRYRNE